jgi:predicted DNA-binding transcriptional regulator YafY
MSADMQSSTSIVSAFAASTPQIEAESAPVRLPLARLLQLVMTLQSERFPNARRLAELCGVSRRTIYRDLTILEAAGLTIVYHPARQGYQLGRECLLKPPQLDQHEALALLMTSHFTTIPEPFGSLLPVRDALAKVFQSLPSGLRDRLASGGELISQPAQPATEIPEERRAVHQAILNALLSRQRIRLTYREDARGAMSTTDLGLYRLAWIRGQWALVGHSSSHGGVWLYWLPWVEKAEATALAYAIPPRFHLEKFLARLRPDGHDRQQEVHLRFSANMAAVIRDMPECDGQTKRPGPDGTLDLFLKVATLEEIISWVLSFGDQVEVLGPDELRESLRDWARRIVRRHSSVPG